MTKRRMWKHQGCDISNIIKYVKKNYWQWFTRQFWPFQYGGDVDVSHEPKRPMRHLRIYLWVGRGSLGNIPDHVVAWIYCFFLINIWRCWQKLRTRLRNHKIILNNVEKFTAKSQESVSFHNLIICYIHLTWRVIKCYEIIGVKSEG